MGGKILGRSKFSSIVLLEIKLSFILQWFLINSECNLHTGNQNKLYFIIEKLKKNVK